MAEKGYFDPNIESNVYPAAQQDMVISENVAMYINGTWLPNEVAETTPDDFKWCAFPCRKNCHFSLQCCTELLILSEITVIQLKQN